MFKKKAKNETPEERQKRTDECAKKVKSLLDKYDCQLAVSMTITPQGNFPDVKIATKGEEATTS